MNTTSKINLCLLLSSIMFVFGAIEVRSELRKFVFADGYPTGKFTLEKSLGYTTNTTPAPIAKGNVSVFVPPGSSLLLNINPHCLEHPEKLAMMPTDGIDQIRISYMSMDDDVHVCDKGLAAIPLFKKPLGLSCLRTDVTDAGLINFKSLSMVTDLNCFLSDVDGSFLTEWKRLQNLQTLNLGNNSIKGSNLKALGQLKSLHYLDLRETNLSDDGLQEVGKIAKLRHLCISSNARLTDQGLQCLSKCSALENLNLGYDKNLTDKSIATIQKLSHLITLNLTHTKISEPALEGLKGLKLKTLVLPEHYWKLDVEKLQKALPSTLLKFASENVSNETQIQFAPLK